MSRPIQIDIIIPNTMFIILHNLIQIINSWIKNIAIHSEAMSRSLSIRSDPASKTEQIDLLIRVVVLQDPAHLVYHLQVLVLAHVPIVEGVVVLGVSV